MDRFNGLFEAFGDDREILLEIFEEFESTKEGYFENIEKAIKENSPKELELHSHTLKGVMRNFYDDQSTPLLEKLELMGRSGSIDNESAEILYNESKAEVLNFIKDLKVFLSNKAS